jgi:hypothetical protein
MDLTTITITGIDDNTTLDYVEEMAASFPYLELGVLLSRSRKGTPRYPSPNWLSAFVERFGASDAHGQFSLHVCGGLSDRMTEYHARTPFETRDYFGGAPLSSVFERVQLNGFPESTQEYAHINMLASTLSDTAAVILPIPNRKTIERARQAFLPNVHFLHDRSRGKGVAPSSWPEAIFAGHTGFAGGLNPDNIRSVLDLLCARPDPRKFWLDLESGARTDDVLDPVKVERILRIGEEYVRLDDS